ncbi:MAG: CRTAC1 family protein [Planctomycetes bacterium]|nr:CRTAC1 family protein [Planctomycetota bacterium]
MTRIACLAVSTLVLGLAPVGNPYAQTPTAPAPGAPPKTSHERMLELLRGVREQSLRSNVYLGTAIVDAFEKRLAQPTAPGKELERWRMEVRYAQELLRVGRTAEAIEVGRRVVARLDDLRATLAAEELADAAFGHGTAWMRLGENENCCLKFNAESCLLPIQGGGRHTEKEGSTNAVTWFTRALELAPAGSKTAIKARWLLNIAHMTLGTWPDGVPEAQRIPASVFQSDEPFPRFVDVSSKVGLERADLAGGAVAEDFDGDGKLELLISSSDTAGQLRYYDDASSGRFVDRTHAAHLDGLVGGLNLVSGDYDDDGDVDVLVLRGAWWRKDGLHPKSLLQNDGHGVFTDVTLEAGLGASRYPTQTAGFADYDNDGDLDLYIGNEDDPEVVAPSELYQNDGKGHFTNVAAAAGVTNDRYTKAVAWGDFDNDRYPDLYVSNMAEPNRLYHNRGDGTFEDVTEKAGVGLPISSFPAWFFDYDQDGALDLFVAGFGGPGVAPSVADVAASWLGLPHQGEPLHLYEGDGKGGFRDVAKERKLTLYPLPMGSNFGDLDNDGFPDLYLGTGYPYYEGLIPNVMYRNQRGKGFANVTFAGGFGHLQKGHGVVFADLDGDGDQDVLEEIGGAYPGDAYHVVLFENPGFGAHWIHLALRGEGSNRFGVGAQLSLEIVDGTERRTVRKVVNTGGSFGCNPLRQELGVGGATRIEKLEVFWPTTNTRQVFESVPVDRVFEVREGAKELRELERKPFRLGEEPSHG